MPSPSHRPPAGAAVLREDITSAIQTALVTELASVGYGRLSIEAVARRANVGKTAVYRRWDSKLDMVVDFVSNVAGQTLIIPDMGSLRADLEHFMRLVAKALQHPLASQIIPDLLAEAARNPAIGDTLHRLLRDNQRHVTTLLIGRAITRGEVPDSTDSEMAFGLIVGPIYWLLLITRASMTKDHLRKLASATAAALQNAATGEVRS